MVANRVGVKNMQRVVIAPVRGGAFDLDTILEDVEPGIIIVDSLQGLIGPVGKDAESILLLERLKDHAIEHECPSIVLSHVNKDEEAAGVYTLQHTVDATFLLLKGAEAEQGEDEDGEHCAKCHAKMVKPDEKARTLHVTKNRYGEAPSKGVFTMTTRGLVSVGSKRGSGVYR